MAYAVVVTWLAVAGWRTARSAARVGWSREQLLCLGGITAAFLAWTATVPHAPWQTNFHGFGRVPGVENAHWWSPLGQGGVHGVLDRHDACARWPHGRCRVRVHAQRARACGGLGGAVGRALGADPSAGLGFAAMLASAPVWVRPRWSLPTPGHHGVPGGPRDATGLRRGRRRVRPARVCAVWVLLADLHAELLLLAPAILAAHGMVERAPWRRDPLGCGHLGWRVRLPRWARCELASSELGAQGTVASRAMDLAGAPARWPVTQAVAVVTAWWLLRGALWDRDAELPEHAWRGLLGAAVVGWLALMWGVPVGYDPDLPPSAGPLSAYAYLQPWWHLGYAPPHGLIAVGIGALVLGWRAPARAWWLVCAVAISTGFYAGGHASRRVRTRLSTARRRVCVGVAAAHQVLTRAGPSPSGRGGAGARDRRGQLALPFVTQYRFPMQQEHVLLGGFGSWRAMAQCRAWAGHLRSGGSVRDERGFRGTSPSFLGQRCRCGGAFGH